jgi:hypothetical protein
MLLTLALLCAGAVVCPGCVHCISGVVSEALKAHEAIAREGLAAYYQKSMPE